MHKEVVPEPKTEPTTTAADARAAACGAAHGAAVHSMAPAADAPEQAMAGCASTEAAAALNGGDAAWHKDAANDTTAKAANGSAVLLKAAGTCASTEATAAAVTGGDAAWRKLAATDTTAKAANGSAVLKAADSHTNTKAATAPAEPPARPSAGKAVLRFLQHNVFLLLIVAGLAAALLLTGSGHRIAVQDILDFTPRNPWLAAVLLLVLFGLKGLTAALPYNVLVVAAGLLYPLPIALAINICGTVLCIWVPYLTGRHSKESLVDQLLNKNKRLRQWYESQRGYTFFFSVFLRAIGLSNELLGLFFGSLGADPGSYFFSSLLAITPNMLFLTVLGGTLDDPLNPATIALCGVMLCMSGGVVIAYFLKRRHDTRAKKAAAAACPVEDACFPAAEAGAAIKSRTGPEKRFSPQPPPQ